MHYTLRPYQQSAIDLVRDSFRKGNKRIVIVSPTGSGKTSIACSLIESAITKGKRALFLAHRTELIEQASARLDSIGIDHGVIQASHKRFRSDSNVYVASVQTLIRRDKPEADLVIVDECAHSCAKSYKHILDSYPCAAILGLTATPWRLDGRGLKSVFNDLIVVAQSIDLIPNYLMQPKIFAPDRPVLSTLKIHAGDFDLQELERIMSAKKLVGSVVERWIKLAGNARTLVFAVGVDHSKLLRDRFLEAGIKAEHIDAKTPANERAAILQRLKTGETRIVTNCQILTEGYDLPELGCVSLARPTQSSSLFLQMVGRIMRPAPGKAAPIILDHADCVRRHGHPIESRSYTLEDVEKISHPKKNDPDRVKICQTCFAVNILTAQNCSECGSAFVAEPIEVEEIDGAFVELTPYERKQNDAWLELEEERKKYGYKPGWSLFRFKARFGYWPRRKIKS